MKIGDTFIWFPPDGRKEHLFIVLTSPQNNNGKFAAVNLTMSLGGPMALTLQIGDHPFITKYPSDVNFGDALIFDMQTVIVQSTPHEPMQMSIVQKIIKMAVGHCAIPEEVEDMIKADSSIK